MYDLRHEGKMSILLKLSYHLIILLIYLNSTFITSVSTQDEFETDENLVHYYMEMPKITTIAKIKPRYSAVFFISSSSLVQGKGHGYIYTVRLKTTSRVSPELYRNRKVLGG